MAQQHINTGAAANDDTGDTLRLSQIKAESNFTELYTNKVDKVSGRGLSEVNFSQIDKDKLDGLSNDAVTQADWDEGDNLEPSYINNKPENLSDFFNDLPQYLNAIGSFNYSDLATQTTPLNAVSGTPLKLTNDTDGDYTNTSFAPFGISSTWNATTNQFDFTQLSLGDWVEFRTDMFIDLTGTNTSYALELRCAVGDTNAWVLPIHNGERKSTTGFGETHDFAIVMEYQFTIDNPAELWIVTDANATIKVNGWQTRVTRKNINIVDIAAPAPQQITRAEVLALISSNGLVKGAFYKITDCHSQLYGGTTIWLQAIETNKLSPKGVGEFYTPKYTTATGNGIWTRYVETTPQEIYGEFDEDEFVTADNGATGQFVGFAEGGLIIPLTGDWSSVYNLEGDESGATVGFDNIVLPLEYAIGDMTIFGGRCWTNLTGDVGEELSYFELNSPDWEVIPYNDTDYNVSYDDVNYDIATDFIFFRRDKLNNVWSAHLWDFDEEGSYNDMKFFQWGRYNTSDHCTASNSMSSSFVDNINFRGSRFTGNTFGSLVRVSGFLASGIHVRDCVFEAESYFSNCSFGLYSVLNGITLNQKASFRAVKVATATLYNISLGQDAEFTNVKGVNLNIQYTTLGHYARFINTTLGNGASISATLGNYANISATLGAGAYITATLGNGAYISATLGNGAYISATLGNGASIYGANTALLIDNAIIESGTNITGVDFTSATIIQSPFPKTIYARPDGALKIRYYNNSDALTIVNINA